MEGGRVICLFCHGENGVKGVTCLDCGRDPKRAARELLKRVNSIAEADIIKGNPITGAHHRAIVKVLKEAA